MVILYVAKITLHTVTKLLEQVLMHELRFKNVFIVVFLRTKMSLK